VGILSQLLQIMALSCHFTFERLCHSVLSQL